MIEILCIMLFALAGSYIVHLLAKYDVEQWESELKKDTLSQSNLIMNDEIAREKCEVIE